MIITSTSFIIVFILFFLFYWLFRIHRIVQNFLILAFSCFFYGMWDVRFLVLLLVTALFTYGIAHLISQRRGKNIAKVAMIFHIVATMGVLFLFKYYNFFAGEFAAMFGLESDKILLKLALPVGISFYTFTAVGYVIDIYRNNTKTPGNLLSFMSFLTFFPLILSGPIERSTTLLPQFKKERTFDYELAKDGVMQIVWGFFKKLVLADNCAFIVNTVFGTYQDQPASALWIGAILYSIQIYCDFSGYSDMAIGLSKLLGFRVRRNFNYPYFSLNVADFWRRWHMSLQSWFVDYIYIPLGGSRCSKGRVVLNTLIVFTVCGIWHGANWTFIAWGIYHGVLFIPLILLFSKEFRKRKVNENRLLPTLTETGLMLLTFLLITFGWIMFNSPSIGAGAYYIAGMFSTSIMKAPGGIGIGGFGYVAVLLVMFFCFEWSQRSKEYPMQFKGPGWVKVCLMYVMIAHLIFCNAAQTDFIYFQF